MHHKNNKKNIKANFDGVPQNIQKVPPQKYANQKNKNRARDKISKNNNSEFRKYLQQQREGIIDQHTDNVVGGVKQAASKAKENAKKVKDKLKSTIDKIKKRKK